jgi:hypothetical protein
MPTDAVLAGQAASRRLWRCRRVSGYTDRGRRLRAHHVPTGWPGPCAGLGLSPQSGVAGHDERSSSSPPSGRGASSDTTPGPPGGRAVATRQSGSGGLGSAGLPAAGHRAHEEQPISIGNRQGRIQGRRDHHAGPLPRVPDPDSTIMSAGSKIGGPVDGERTDGGNSPLVSREDVTLGTRDGVPDPDGAIMTAGGSPEGSTTVLEADIREPGKILAHAAEILDLQQPVAVITMMILHYLPDEHDPWGIVRRLIDGSPGSAALVIGHAGSDIAPEPAQAAAEKYNARSPLSVRLRARGEVARFFAGAGLEILRPGRVPLAQWWPAEDLPQDANGYVGIGWRPARRGRTAALPLNAVAHIAARWGDQRSHRAQPCQPPTATRPT